MGTASIIVGTALTIAVILVALVALIVAKKPRNKHWLIWVILLVALVALIVAPAFRPGDVNATASDIAMEDVLEDQGMPLSSKVQITDIQKSDSLMYPLYVDVAVHDPKDDTETYYTVGVNPDTHESKRIHVAIDFGGPGGLYQLY